MFYKSSHDMLNALFCELLKEVYPTAEYISYVECKHFDGFEIHYKKSGQLKYMLIDLEGNILIGVSV